MTTSVPTTTVAGVATTSLATTTATTAPAGTKAPTAAASTTTTTTTALPQGWIPFADPDGAFDTAFPGEPDEQCLDSPTADGWTIPINAYSYSEGARGFAVASATLPEGIPYSLEGGRDGAVSNVGGTLQSSNDVTLQGRSGIEAVASVTQGNVSGSYVFRIYADDTGFWQLAVSGPGTFGPDDPEVAAFFNAFTFTEDLPAS